MRTCLSPTTRAPSGGLALDIKGSAGVLRTGTFRCFSTLAAAEEAMGLAVRLGTSSSRESDGFCGPEGMVIVSPQEGHSMLVPAPELSTASS